MVDVLPTRESSPLAAWLAKYSRRAIAWYLGWRLNTVLRYARAATWQGTLRENRPRPSRLDLYKPHRKRRSAARCTNITHLHRELIAENAPVTYQMVRGYIATLRAAPPQAPPPLPTVRRVTGWLTRHPSPLSEDERVALKAVPARCPELDTAAERVRGFGELLAQRLGPTLPAAHGSTPSMPTSCPACRTSPCPARCPCFSDPPRPHLQAVRISTRCPMPLVGRPARPWGSRPMHGPRSAAALPMPPRRAPACTRCSTRTAGEAPRMLAPRPPRPLCPTTRLMPTQRPCLPGGEPRGQPAQREPLGQAAVGQRPTGRECPPQLRVPGQRSSAGLPDAPDSPGTTTLPLPRADRRRVQGWKVRTCFLSLPCFTQCHHPSREIPEYWLPQVTLRDGPPTSVPEPSWGSVCRSAATAPGLVGERYRFLPPRSDPGQDRAALRMTITAGLLRQVPDMSGPRKSFAVRGGRL